MGHIIERIAVERGHKIVAKIDPMAEGCEREINKITLKDADVCIEFTIPDIAVENIKKVAALKKNIVVGTTAWYDKLDEVKKIVEESNIGFIYSPNFSIGVNVFFNIVKHTAKIMNNLKDYDLNMKEIHHIHKKDAPSGTGKMIKEIIEEEIERFNNTPIESVREGEVPGTHIVNFDSGVDTIKLEHEAKNREGFALGSVLAAEFIADKKGFFTIEDLMKEIIKWISKEYTQQ